jgi:hypothetical protein
MARFMAGKNVALRAREKTPRETEPHPCNRRFAVGRARVPGPVAPLLEILEMTEPVGLPEFLRALCVSAVKGLLRALKDLSIHSVVSFSPGVGSLNVSASVTVSES